MLDKNRASCMYIQGVKIKMKQKCCVQKKMDVTKVLEHQSLPCSSHQAREIPAKVQQIMKKITCQ